MIGEKKERYYAGIRLEEDLAMCQIYDELEANDDVIILNHDRTALVHEMRYINGYSTDRENTGRTHLGFDFSYITFYYKGRVWSVEPSTYYPFTDDDNPGPINVRPNKLIDGWFTQQEGYATKYEDISSCDESKIDRIKLHKNERLPLRDIPFTINKAKYESILKTLGGAREKAIYEAPHICYIVEDTKDRKVVRCSKLEREPDGVRLSFDIDMNHEKITN